MQKIVKSVYGIFIFLFLYAPIAVLITYSFNANRSRGSWGGFSLKWYAVLFSDSDILEALKNTLFITAVASVVATIIGTLSAIGIYYMSNRLRSLLMNVSYLPVMNPDIVTGISLLLLFIFIGIKLGYVSLLLAHITFNIPYVIISVLPKMRQMNVHTLEAAMDLGAPPVTAFTKAVLPEIMPGVITGFLLAVTMSIDDFVISFFTTGPGINTLSIYIYSQAKKGIKPEINALSAIMFVVVLVLLLIINYRSTGDERRKSNTKKALSKTRIGNKINSR